MSEKDRKELNQEFAEKENDINKESREMKIDDRKCILPAVFCKSPAGVWTQADLCVQ